MKKSNDRTRRVADLIQREVAKIIHRESTDPKIRLVTLTAVKVSPDYSLATIYVVVPDEQEIKPIIQILNDSAKEYRHFLAKEVNMRTTPKLRFIYDESIAYSRKMGELIQKATAKIRNEDDDQDKN